MSGLMIKAAYLKHLAAARGLEKCALGQLDGSPTSGGFSCPRLCGALT